MDFNYGEITDKMTNCCDEISDPTPILVASRIARIMIQSKQDRSWNPIRSINRELTRNSWSDHFFTVIGSFLESDPFRKSFLAWGLNFKQFSAGFNFEIVSHSYKDILSIKTHMCNTDAHQHWHMRIKPERNDIWNTKYTEKKFCVFYFIFFIYFFPFQSIILQY